MDYLFNTQHLKAIQADFEGAYIYRDRISGISEFFSHNSVVVLNNISGQTRILSNQASILIAGKISGITTLIAHKDVIVKGTISGVVKITARTGNIYLMNQVSGLTEFYAPYGNVI